MDTVDYEAAARFYCNEKGMDPEEIVYLPHPKGYAMNLRKKRWQVYALEFADLHKKICLLSEFTR